MRQALSLLFLCQTLALTLPNTLVHKLQQTFNHEFMTFDNHQVWQVQVEDAEQIKLLETLSDVCFCCICFEKYITIEKYIKLTPKRKELLTCGRILALKKKLIFELTNYWNPW